VSRIIIKVYPDDKDHIVVGWDHPGKSFFWQEFNREPEPDAQSGEVNWEKAEDEGWEEMLRYGGYMREYPTLTQFIQSVPADIRALLTDDVLNLLAEHRADPESGRQPPIRLITWEV